MKDKIIVKRAREHNLKNVSLEIPKNKLVVFTGVSGSGKSSMAFDTLYAEGQRRYVESLSSYARQFLRVSSRPDVDLIEGLSPAIAIDQKALSSNPRSTVGTITEIYDYLRLLFARIGHPHCPNCGREISQLTLKEIVDLVEEKISQRVNSNGIAKTYILSPLIKERKGSFEQLFDNLLNLGFETARVDGYFLDLSQEINLIKTNKHTIEAVTDKRLYLKKDFKKSEMLRAHLYECCRQALDLSDGYLIVTFVEDKSFSFSAKPKSQTDVLLSQKFSCPSCNLSVDQFQPNSFSFNSPVGACPECNGLGIKLSIDRTKVPDWKARSLENRYFNTSSDFIRQEIEKLMIKRPCPLCQGARLKKESLSVTVNKKNIYQLTLKSLDKLTRWLNSLQDGLKSEKEKQISQPILREILSRLKFLLAVGLDYLNLSRVAGSLSTGEGQRIRLASQIGTGLTGVLYILDEPTVGLHPRDNKRLIKTLKRLKEIGNNPIIIEHDLDVINSADWLVDFGPLAGKKGGEIVAQGTIEQIKKEKKSLTGQYLARKKKIPILAKQDKLFDAWLKIEGCRQYNLKNIDLKIPLNRLVCITGVSGSGKSTLVEDTLYRAVKKHFNPDFEQEGGKFDKISGLEHLSRALIVDQTPIGKTSRSNPATYTSVFTEIRELFSQTAEARLKGFSKSFFSFNTKGGRCEACQGQGQIKIEMQFLPNIWVNCDICQGQRFGEEVLQVFWHDKNIYQVLQMTIEEGLAFFKSIFKITAKLEKLKAIGLEYLQLGQPSPTLSGGESERLKLARELVKPGRGNTLYILDEPTVGLHFHDLVKLINILRQLVNIGNTVVIIEHNLDVIKNADWIVDLGPEGGEKGGEIVAQGPVDKVVKAKNSYTGQYLAKVS